MNTDNNNRFSPAAELQDAEKPYKHWSIPTLLYIVGMLTILLWAFFTRGCIIENDGGVGGGSGSGVGTGSGKGGNGSGNGTQGKDGGKKQAPAAQGSGETQAAAGNAVQKSEKAPTDSVGKTENAPDIEDLPADDNHKKLVYAPQNHPPKTHVQRGKNTGGTGAGRKGFYGVKSKPGGKVIFLVDVSSSMASPSREMQGKNCLDVLKMQLKQSVFGGDTPTEENSKRSGGFIIMPFSHFTKRFPEKGMYRYRYTKDMQAAGNIIDKELYCNGGTMMCQAWDAALEVVINEKINTVYFLTDGYPGDPFNAQFLNQQLNKKGIKKLTVHCISIGAQRDFMQQIAKEHNGQYVFIP